MIRSVTRTILAMALGLLFTCQSVQAADGSMWLRSGQPAPYSGLLLDGTHAAKMSQQLEELVQAKRVIAAKDDELVALRQLVDVEKASAADWRGLAEKAERAARAARSGRFMDRVKFFGLGMIVGVPFL